MLVATHLLDVDTGSEQTYNALDCCLTHEIFSTLSKQIPDAVPAYSFELALQAPVLEMMLRGFRVNPGTRELGIQSCRKDLARLEHIIIQLASAVMQEDVTRRNPKGKLILPGSAIQLKRLFYEFLSVPQIKTWDKGELKFPMDREVIEQIEDYFEARPIAAAVLAHRDKTKELSVLQTEVDDDWRMRTSYNIGGTKSARFSSSKSPTGSGCVLPTVEVLTPNGWQRISLVADGTLIMQWDAKTDELEFRPCLIHVDTSSGSMLRVETEQVKQTLTPEHRVPHFSSRMTDFYVRPARDVAQLSQEVLPLGGRYIGGELELPRYVAMLMADFSREEYQWRGEFTKQRKINRFLSLATEFNLNYGERKAKEGYRRFVLPNTGEFPKKWGKWILDLTTESAEDLLEEARYWDAHDRGSGFIFFTADYEQASWFATLAHLTGRAATIRREEQHENSYSDTIMWWVNVKNRKHARVQKKHWSTITYEGKVYCPQVPSTHWLIREDNFISITGNTNLQNITEDLRHILVPDPGYVLCGIDAEQSDSRMVGYMCGLLFDDWTYLDACESGDTHTYVARLTWPSDLPWTGDIKLDRKIAEQPYYRHFSYRDCCKKLAHGTNFLGKAPTLSKLIHIPKDLIIPFQERYFDAFPAIPKWHAWTAEHLQKHKQLTSIHGRKRDFFDRTNADETVRKGLAFLAAAPTADNLNLGMWRVWRYMPEVQLLAQVHDAIYFQFPETLDKHEVISKAQELMTVELTAPNGRRFIVPTEAKTGYNWSNASDRNPKGLKKFSVN